MNIKAWIITKAIQGKLPRWIYRLAGKKLAEKLGITEDNMADETVVKKWYQSKGKLAAIVTVIVGAIGPISQAFGHPITVPSWVIEVLIGLGIYGVRDAIKS